MTTRTKLQTITLSVLTFIALTLSSHTAHAQLSGSTLTTPQAVTGLEVIVKRSNGDTMRYNVSSDGSFSLGMLAEGSYTLTLSFNSPANAKTYFESRSNTTRSVTVMKGFPKPMKDAALQEGKVVIWDPKLNQLAEVSNMSLRPVQGITLDVKAGEEVSGNIAAFGAKDFPNVQTN